MRRFALIFVGVTGIVTDVAVMQILITTFSTATRGNVTWPNFLIWLICAIACYLINLAVLKRSASVPMLAGINLLMLAAMLFVILSTLLAIAGFLTYAALVVFSIITVAGSFRLALSPISLSSQLLRFDVLVLALFWLFLNYASGLSQTDLPLMVIILMLNLVCNIVLRAAESDVGSTLFGSPIAGTLLYCGLIGGAAALAFFLVRFLSSGSRVMVSAAISAVKAAILGILGVLERFFTWLIRLLPYVEPDGEIDLEPPSSMESIGGDEILAASPTLMYVLIAAFAAIAAASFIYILYRMRGRRIKLNIRINAPGISPRRKRRAGAFKRKILALIWEIKFIITSALRLNTPPGTLLYLERWGKKHARARGAGESMRGYLLRLSPDGLLLPLAIELDSIYFGGKRQTLSKLDCSRLRREFLKDCPKRAG